MCLPRFFLVCLFCLFSNSQICKFVPTYPNVNSQAGGNLHTFEEECYEFDTGLHYVGGRVGEKDSPLSRLFGYLTDGEVKWAPMDKEAVDMVVLGSGQGEEGAAHPVPASPKAFRETLRARFPDETAAIDAYFNLIRNNKLHIAVLFLWKLLPPTLASCFATLCQACGLMDNYQRHTLADKLEALNLSPELRAVLTYSWGDYGDVPSCAAAGSHFALTEHFFGGGYYPVGGPARLAHALVRTIERRGGKVLVRAPVHSIIVNEQTGRAQGVSVRPGRHSYEVLAPLIISSIGAYPTLCRLLPRHERDKLSPSRQKQLSSMSEQLLSPDVAPRLSFMSCFIGFEASKEEVKVPNRNYWIFPTVSPDHTANVKSFKEDTNAPFPAAFVSFSSSKDPLYAARHGPKAQVALVIVPSFYDHFEDFAGLGKVKHRGIEYNEFKKSFQTRIVKLFHSHFPQITPDMVKFVDTGTPLSNDYYLGNYRGASYGLQHSPARFRLECLRSHSPVPGLYLTGQDTFCNGIAGAATAGLVTAMVLDRGFMLRQGLRFLI